MNYYEHHIGDYDKNTSHLTACEDGIYSRLIRRYYDKEKPLPADVDQVKRLARARDKLERAAVDTILEEFFTLEADGWHHKVCDAVIAAYLAGEPEREAKKANEETRLKRHREERSALFTRLTEAGQHAPWNIGTKELRSLVAALQKADPDTKPATKPETPATAPATPATATQTPDTIPHSPDTIPQKLKDKDASPDGEDAAGAAGTPPVDPPPPPAPPAPPPPKSPEELTRTELWRAGKSLLREQEMPEAQCGTFVGKLVKDYGEAIVVEAVRSAVVQRPADAATWLVGACKAAKVRAGGVGKPGQLTGDQQVAASLAKAQRVAAAMAPKNGEQRPAANPTELIDG